MSSNDVQNCRRPGCLAIGFFDQLRHSGLAGSVNRNKRLGFALLGPDFGNIDMEISDRVAFELVSLGFVASDVWQSGYPCRCRQRNGKERLRCGIEGEAGCTIHEIKAITDHKSDAEVRRYAEKSDPRCGRRARSEPPRVYRRVKHSKDEPYDEETIHPRLSG